jgi:predicted dehydrogenase
MHPFRPNIAIVGAGLMGHWHATAARRAGARVSAVVDADAGRAARLASQCGASRYVSVEALLEVPERLDAAHICTPLSSHVGLVRTFIERGVNIVCEKPLAASAAAVAEMYAQAREARREICPVHQFTCQRGVVRARERLGELGELRRIAFDFHSAGGRGHDGAQLDAIVQDILPHPLSVLAVLQPHDPLDQVSWHCVQTVSGELLATGRHGSAAVSISISLSARPTEASATVSGTGGSMTFDFFHGFATLRRGHASRSDKVLRPFTNAVTLLGAASGNALRRASSWETAYPGLRSLLTKFYASIGASKAPPPFSESEVIGIYRGRDRIVAAISREAGA